MKRRFIGRVGVVMLGLALVGASCSGDDEAAPSTTGAPPETAATTTSSTEVVTTTTTTPASSTTSTTTTTVPESPTLAVQGDTNETVEAAQFLLNCSGFGDLTVDGVFGPATRAAVEAAQTGLGRPVDGEVDDDLMAALSRACSEDRRLQGDGVITVVGNTAPEDPAVFSIALLSGSTMAATVTRAVGLTVTVTRADDGSQIVTGEGGSAWQIDVTQDYLIEVAGAAQPTTFALALVVTPGERETGDWILGTGGLTYRGTTLSLGDDAEAVIDQVVEFLGHGVRGAYDEFDTGWYAITEPADMGLRGIFIEGFALLFFGPDPNNPDRPETFVRHRFEGPTVDGAGNPRPERYATTAEGITIGDTLADLEAAYGSSLSSGSNDDEHYYRFTDGGGELCFYFDTPDEPTDYAPIVEIASECRAG